MKEPSRSQWQIRCAFNGFCLRVLKNEAINAHKQLQRKQHSEVTFSDLTPFEENELYSLDDYFGNEPSEVFNVAGREITSKLLADALRNLPEEKRKTVLLYYFMDMSDVEISEMLNVPRSTVQYRRSSSFEQLRRYLEEYAGESDKW